ncbi:MAG: TlpA disulfide reductase family protein [Saprospiraceae bacterium]|nr:TlpA family protein disulfide reductase [Lewinella sp.]
MKSRMLFLFTIIFCLIDQTSLTALDLNGRILNFPGKSIQLKSLFGGYLLYESQWKIIVSKTGEFHQELVLPGARFAILVVGEEEIGLFLSPDNSTISLELDYQKPDQLKFTGKSAEAATFMYAWMRKRFYQEYGSLDIEKKEQPKALYAYCDQQRLEAMEKLASISEQMTERDYALWKREIDDYYQALKVYAGLEADYSGQNGRSDWMQNNEQILLESHCDHQFDYVPSYNYLLGLSESYREKTMYQDMMVGDTVRWLAAFEVPNTNEMIHAFGQDSYNRPLYELGKDWMCKDGFTKALANRILRSIRGGDYENLYWLYKQFIALDPAVHLQETLAPYAKDLQTLEAEKNVEKEGINFYPREAFENGVLSIIQQDRFRGNVLLVDLWGTWCGPCREEFPYLKTLKEQLAGEDVVYLYLAAEKLRDPEPHWRETVNYFDLKGDHYLVTKELLGQFKQDINQLLPGAYPTYMIFDRKGKVAQAPAAYPSDGDKLLRQLMVVLKAK